MSLARGNRNNCPISSRKKIPFYNFSGAEMWNWQLGKFSDPSCQRGIQDVNIEMSNAWRRTFSPLFFLQIDMQHGMTLGIRREGVLDGAKISGHNIGLLIIGFKMLFKIDRKVPSLIITVKPMSHECEYQTQFVRENPNQKQTNISRSVKNSISIANHMHTCLKFFWRLVWPIWGAFFVVRPQIP